MKNIDRKRRLHGGIRTRMGRTTLALGAAAIVSLSAVSLAAAGSDESQSAKASNHHESYGHPKRGHSNNQRRGAGQRPIRAMVLTPGPGEKTSSSFNVDVSLQARNTTGNNLLSNYRSLFVDPTGPDGKGNPAFHPGASAAAPGLVVTLSTTPTVDGTPLVGPRTNLAGVFQLNSVTKSGGLRRTWNDWQVTSPGFFGMNTSATLKVYAVQGQAPDVVPVGGLQPVSNVVQETFRIGS